MSIAHESPGLVDENKVISLGDEARQTLANVRLALHEDSNLRPQQDFLNATILVTLGLISFRQPVFKPELIQQGLERWKAMIYSCQDQRDLREHVTDCDALQSRLELLINFLEFKGYAVMRTVAISAYLALKMLLDDDTNGV